MNSSNLVIDPLICSGKPHVQGTRLTADFLQSLVATGWSREEILVTYPYLKPEELDAALAYQVR